jgi:predicted nucleic acid-binding protein
MRNKYLAPSFNDTFALFLAKKNSCCLITGDKALRKAAELEDVVSHGLLWLLDEMVKNSIIKKAQAVIALEKIIAWGSWLPKKECEERFKRWSK